MSLIKNNKNVRPDNKNVKSNNKNVRSANISFIVLAAIISVIMLVFLLNNSINKSRLQDSVIDKDITKYGLSSEIISDNKHPVVLIKMKDGGEMILKLYPEYAPKTVENFIKLAKSGFYKGLTFHRIMKNFMIQGGDPDGTGGGGSDEPIFGEFASNGYTKNTLSHKRGVISMARQADDNNSASSQFFIMHADYAGLDGDYAAFGELIKGEDILDRIADTPCKASEFGDEVSVPVKKVIIKDIVVLKK